MVGDEVGEHDHVARLEGLADALVFGAEDSPVLEVFLNWDIEDKVYIYIYMRV